MPNDSHGGVWPACPTGHGGRIGSLVTSLFVAVALVPAAAAQSPVGQLEPPTIKSMGQPPLWQPYVSGVGTFGRNNDAVMSLLQIPMWLLSGAFFPADSPWLAWIMRLNPLTYGVAGMRRILYWNDANATLPANLPSLSTCWIVTLGFAAVMTGAAWWVSRFRTQGDLQ